MSTVRPLLVVGTRAEAVKMAPIILEARRRPRCLQPIVCFSGQHQELLTDVVTHFGIVPDVELARGSASSDVASLVAHLMQQLASCMRHQQPDCVVVQGDTATALAAALTAFLQGVPTVHVEAGLRTDSLLSPWPEEFNRRVITLATALHCAPTPRQADRLVQEGVDPARITVTGNPVVDALQWTLERGRDDSTPAIQEIVNDRRPLLLVTAHRRESFDGGIAGICQAVGELARRLPAHQIAFPVHPNPQVLRPVRAALSHVAGVRLLPPLPYPEMVELLQRATLLLTDSGGLQEEAPSLRLPVLVMRDRTERVELLERGGSLLVGTDPRRIVHTTLQLLNDPRRLSQMRVAGNPYGDGQAATRIVDLLASRAWDLSGLSARTCEPRRQLSWGTSSVSAIAATDNTVTM